jgi:DNA-binding XRE family transcriptional regulator
VAWRLDHGREEIPENMKVCHICDNPSCINPKHLFLGSHQDNMDDMRQKGRGASKLNWDKVYEIRKIRGKPHREIAEIYGVSRGTISAILRGESWNTLTKAPE